MKLFVEGDIVVTPFLKCKMYFFFVKKNNNKKFIFFRKKKDTPPHFYDVMVHHIIKMCRCIIKMNNI